MLLTNKNTREVNMDLTTYNRNFPNLKQFGIK